MRLSLERGGGGENKHKSFMENWLFGMVKRRSDRVSLDKQKNLKKTHEEVM